MTQRADHLKSFIHHLTIPHMVPHILVGTLPTSERIASAFRIHQQPGVMPKTPVQKGAPPTRTFKHHSDHISTLGHWNHPTRTRQTIPIEAKARDSPIRRPVCAKEVIIVKSKHGHPRIPHGTSEQRLHLGVRRRSVGHVCSYDGQRHEGDHGQEYHQFGSPIAHRVGYLPI